MDKNFIQDFASKFGIGYFYAGYAVPSEIYFVNCASGVIKDEVIRDIAFLVS